MTNQMPNVEFIDKEFLKINNAEASIVLVPKESSDSSTTKSNKPKIPKHKWINAKALESFGYKGGSPFFLQEEKTLYIPIATKKDGKICQDSLREAGATAMRTLKNYPFRSAKIGFYGDKERVDFVLGALLGGYSFNQYKKSKKDNILKTLFVSNECFSGEKIAINHALAESKKAKILAETINFVRDLINTPPQTATPKYLADKSQEIATKAKIKCKILTADDLKKEKMEAFLAVARASDKPPRLIHLSYTPKDSTKNATKLPKIVLVGKGLTYDSGGLSLKPADYMTTMKADKSGACAVLGIINVLAQLNAQVQVDAILGAAENMIGGNAYKPDDVLFSREGVTIEVKNTDAEGRLVLADCLSYAQDLAPDVLIDFATLTGACVVGLGEYTSGIMGYNENLKEAFEKSALKSGELVARLPFNRHIGKLIESKIADVSNAASSRYGGAISAGMFLGEFIRDEYKDKWLHIDIAGPAFVEKEWDINPYGASGAGVRMGVEFILDNYARDSKQKSPARNSKQVKPLSKRLKTPPKKSK